MKLFVIVAYLAVLTNASIGDHSPIYQNCLKSCTTHNCTESGKFTPEAGQQQELACYLLKWRCVDECRYSCMWKTVDAYYKQGLSVPKFHGKWPFTRVLCVQEPGSALASLLNFYAHYHMAVEVGELQLPVKVSLQKFWEYFSLVCMNAWVWSAVFHTRDTAWTEFMDYSCAMSMIVALFLSAIFRVLHRHPRVACVLVLPVVTYFCEHVLYLSRGEVDYEYNMRANVIIGTCASVVWLWWALAAWAGGARHARLVALFTALSGAALALELLDFPPLAGAWDAHALWHLATAPLPLLFYRFVMEDLKYLAGVPDDKYKAYSFNKQV